MKIFEFIGELMSTILANLGQEADTEKKTDALMLLGLFVLFLIIIGGMFWLFYRFM